MAINKEHIRTIVEDLEDKRGKVNGEALADVPAGHMADAVYGYTIDLLKDLIKLDELSKRK